MKTLQLQIMALFLVLILVVLGIAVVLNNTNNRPNQGSDQVVELETYNNQRFGYDFSYPRELIASQKESQNNDGVTLYSDSKTIEIRAFAAHNALNQSFDEIREEARSDFGQIDRSQENGEVVVIRGRIENQQRVERVELSDNVVYHLVITYPDQALTDATLDTLLNSFTVY